MSSTIPDFPDGTQPGLSNVAQENDVSLSRSHRDPEVALFVLEQPTSSDDISSTLHQLPQRQAAQCRQWNSDRDHQMLAGKARAKQFTHESQSRAAFARNEQLFAQFRAEQGLPPIFAEAVRKYVTPEMIRSLCGNPIPAELQQQIYRAWCAGCPYGVAKWLNDPSFGPYVEEWLARDAAGWVQPALPELLSAPVDEDAPADLARLANWPPASEQKPHTAVGASGASGACEANEEPLQVGEQKERHA